MSSSIGNCNECNYCSQNNGYICKLDGNFYSTGEYSNTLKFFDIHGVTFNQKIDSVKSLLDTNTLQILKVLLTENDAQLSFDALTSLQIVHVLDFIQSRLSIDNNEKPTSFSINSLLNGDDIK